MVIYYAPITIYGNVLILAANEEGLVYVSAPGETLEDIEKHLQKYIPTIHFKFNFDFLKPYVSDFEKVASGEKQNFDTDYVLYGTDFQKQVWQALANIPYGETRSYSDIAKEIDNPKAYRAVGSAVGRNPLMLRIPCHRIVHKNGSIKGFRGGMSLKKTLLDKEGISWESDQ